MTANEFQSEKQYYISRSIAKSMLEKAIIDEDVFSVINEKLLKKYHPVFATLVAGNPLTL